ncbi:MAG: hypothetical protein LBE99_04585 [Puniceicoccales bacterium]|jgi:uncharacterized Zn ribbon protein|nr:hypothetical protein [Puniceicoccales bacterium]
MYNEQLEKLIELSLADGELTEKEKQVLFKKAEAAGIDLDEFEVVLDAKLYEKQQALKKTDAPAASAPKSDKLGDVKKCPSCGAIAQSFQTKCLDCGHEFSNIEANTSANKLFHLLDAIESQRNDGVADGVLKKLPISRVLGIGNKTDTRKKDIIKNFPIPNTKEDILEFLSLAVPNARQKGNFFTKDNPGNAEHNEFVPVWKAKCEQIVMKARFSMKDDKKTLAEIENYAQQLGIK